jgi:hypothetical protein
MGSLAGEVERDQHILARAARIGDLDRRAQRALLAGLGAVHITDVVGLALRVVLLVARDVDDEGFARDGEGGAPFVLRVLGGLGAEGCDGIGRAADGLAGGRLLDAVAALIRDRVYGFGLSTLTGSLAGILMSLDSGVTGNMPVIALKAFPAALVGGLDSLGGALIGALIIAAAEVLLIYYVDPLLSDVVPFLVLLAMLVVRPWGLFGTREELDRV